MKAALTKIRRMLPAWLWALPFLGIANAAEPIPLRAGPVTMVFEPDNAFLRYIRAGDHEILRGITAPVRNQFWGTVLPVVSNVKLDDKGDHFTLHFDALCREREIDFLWHGSISGSAAGEIEYTFDGTAGSTFQRNRIGFCVLHGPSAAGKPWVLENVSGAKSKGSFPDFISPHQPAKDLREIAHELAPGLWAHVRMEGETFEMEDQRNWTDASFKTYCTPLGLPYPVTVAQGSRVTQKITISLKGGTLPKKPEGVPSGERTVLTLRDGESPMPRLGLQVSSQTDSLTDIEVARLKALRLDHLRVDLEPAGDDFRRKLSQAAAQANALGVKLLVGLRLGKPGARAKAAAGPQLVTAGDGGPALDRLVAEVKSLQPPVSVWLLIGADPALFRLAKDRLSGNGTVLVGPAHEDVNFTQLNRFRPAPDMMDVVAYGIVPQIHAFDNLSIMETLSVQADTVRSARQFIGRSPLYITPVTLRLQAAAQEPLPGELPSTVDPRQASAFAAAWTLGSFKYLAESGVSGVTYFETIGWKGIMESAAGSPLPDKFPSKPGGVFPIYHVLRAIADFHGGNVQRVDSSDTLAVAGLALKSGARRRVLVANLTGRPQPVVVRGLGERVEVRQLDAQNALSAGQPDDPFTVHPASPTAAELPLVLPPGGIIRIDRRIAGEQK